jgi:hypothetical protein
MKNPHGLSDTVMSLTVIIIEPNKQFLFFGKDCIPVFLHIHNDPAICIRLIESLVQLTHMAFAVIGIFTICISVVKEKPQPPAFAGCGVFNHLYVTVRIAKCKYRTLSDVFINPYGLAGLSLIKLIFGIRTITGLPSITLYSETTLEPITCSFGIP